MPVAPPMNSKRLRLMFIHIINSASKRVWLASPYFVPDDAVIQAIQLAGMRGVDIRILIPDKSDNLLVQLAAYSYLDDVKLTGARFYRYERGFLHQKVMLVDDRVSMIGTANFDNRSFRLNLRYLHSSSTSSSHCRWRRCLRRIFRRPGSWRRASSTPNRGGFGWPCVRCD